MTIAPDQARVGIRRDRRAAAADERLAAWSAPRRGTAAAIRWRDVTLPGLGRVRAAAWPPAMVLAIGAVALVYLLQTGGVATTGYDIQRLQAERADWVQRNEQLRLELAKRQSLTWVEAEAVGRLGMQRPEGLTYIRVPDSAAAAGGR